MQAVNICSANDGELRNAFCVPEWPAMGICCNTRRPTAAPRETSREMILDERRVDYKPVADARDHTSFTEADPIERMRLSQAVESYLNVVSCRYRILAEDRQVEGDADERDTLDMTLNEPEAEWELEESDEPARDAVIEARRGAQEARQFVEQKRLEMKQEQERYKISAELFRADQKMGEVAARRAELADFLLQRGFRGADVPKTKLLRKTYPLHMAVAEGSKRIVELLLADGVDSDRKDSSGRTALQLAMKNGNAQIVDLLRRDSRVTQDSLPEPLPRQAKETERRTPCRSALGGA